MANKSAIELFAAAELSNDLDDSHDVFVQWLQNLPLVSGMEIYRQLTGLLR